MAKYLVILESPKKIHSFSEALSKDYTIVASYGHVYDLPEKELSVDIKDDFKPTFEILPGKEDVAKTITKYAKDKDVIYIMTDEDCEGFGLGYNIYRFLLNNYKNVKRAVTNAINKKDILKGIENAVDINDTIKIVDAYEARRITDRLCGYKTSWLTKQATGGSSAGRVQSAGLRVLADREKEIKEFVPIIYWPIEVELLTLKKEKITALIKEPKPLDIHTEKEALEIISVLKNKPVKVSKYEVKNVNVNPYAPFSTSTLQQAASNILGFSPDKTMKVAQILYEKGYQTYLRTDSIFMVPDFISAIRTNIKNGFSDKYLPKTANVYKTKSKNAQEAHEAIRPTDINITSCPLGLDENKLYQLVWKRTVASQMTPAIFERRSVEFSCEKYILSANGSKELFDGFRKVWTYSSSEDKYLPDLKVGDIVDVIDAKTEEKQTQPPSRYSESSFIKKLEELGIGRPSTYATIPKTLIAREYIKLEKGKSISVTELGMNVCEFLVNSNFCFVDLGFTNALEDKLDDIANGKVSKLETLNEFWTRLKQDIENSKGIKKQLSETGISCPKCGGNILKKNSKFGAFYGCSNYKDKENPCDYTAKVGEHGELVEKEIKIKEYYSEDCPKCGAKMVKRASKYGEFWGCSKYPACKTMIDMNGKIIQSKKKNGKFKYKKGGGN